MNWLKLIQEAIQDKPVNPPKEFLTATAWSKKLKVSRSTFLTMMRKLYSKNLVEKKEFKILNICGDLKPITHYNIKIKNFNKKVK